MVWPVMPGGVSTNDCAPTGMLLPSEGRSTSASNRTESNREHIFTLVPRYHGRAGTGGYELAFLDLDAKQPGRLADLAGDPGGARLQLDAKLVSLLW
jgi:hypothetical protein